MNIGRKKCGLYKDGYGECGLHKHGGWGNVVCVNMGARLWSV